MTSAPILPFEQSLTERHEGAEETLSGRFFRVREQYGDRIAVTLGERHVSYTELEAAAGKVCDELLEAGAGPGTLVAICLERGVEMMAAMLGVAMTGAAYLPIDPAYPVTRIAETIEDARPIALIGPEGLQTLPGGLSVDPRTAYVIYTSGSTGQPKGVLISRESVLQLLDETAGWFDFGPTDVWTMFHSFSFDFSVWEIWGALLTGGRLVIVPFSISRSPMDFRELLVREQVTVLNQTPSAFALLNWVDARAGETRGKLALRVVIFGGEALSLGSLREWMARHGDQKPELINMYGITETTVHVTYRRIRVRDLDEWESLIGVPIPHLQLRLLDAALAPVADGQEGELCVSGGGVALGYLRRPELTAERFVLDPATGERIYRSGDMARRRQDGELVYLGRRDGQVKIAGFRIELGEVEAALIACAGVQQACAMASNGRLAAFVTGTNLSPASMGADISSRVPAHMRPSLYHVVEQWPLTVNGKVDRAALLLLAERPTRTTSPENAMQGVAETVSRIWRDALEVPAMGMDENFFDVGGTSLLLVRVRAELEAELGREIPVVWMFECTTIRALAAKLEGTGADKDNTAIENARKAKMAFGRAKAMRGAR